MMLSGLPGVGPLQGRLECERRERDHPVERDGKADVRHAGLEVGQAGVYREPVGRDVAVLAEPLAEPLAEEDVPLETE